MYPKTRTLQAKSISKFGNAIYHWVNTYGFCFAFKMEKVLESSIHSWMVRKMKKFGWGFSKWYCSYHVGVSIFLSYWAYVMSIERSGHVEKMICKGTFPQARSFIRVIANWSLFGMCIWFAALFCLWKYARYCIECCRWELHFPWGNAMECTCGIDGSCRN